MKQQNKNICLLLFLFLLGGSLVFTSANATPGSNKNEFTNVILIGWDGTDRDTLLNLLQTDKLPNLKKIAQPGVMVKTEITTGRTETKPGWAEILTGYSSKTVGVINNRTMYRPIPKGYTIFERLKEAFGKKGIATIFLAGKRPNLGARGPHRVWVSGPRDFWDLEDVWGKGELLPAPEMILKMEGEPYASAKPTLDIYQNGLGEGETVVKKALECIKKYKKSRFFMFAHFEEPDKQGHVSGGYSGEYIKGILDDDRWLGMIVAALKQYAIYDKTLIYIVTDHGFDIKGHSHFYEPHTWLITNDPTVTRGTGDRKDVTPTILSRYGLDLRKIYPPLEGTVLSNK
jgi:predicted AlkP superfamily pyrophosphatase or phosphodiesterase